MNTKAILVASLLLFVRCKMSESVKIEDGSVNVNGVQLYYKIMGEGEPVVTLHGGPGFDHKHMLPFGELAEGYKVVFYDQRTTGNSTGVADSTSITVDNFVEDLEGLRKRLNLGKMNLLGHSWGAALAMFYGIKYPENLRTLILLSPSGSSAVFDEYFKDMQKRTTPEDARALKEIEQSQEFKNREVEAVQKYFRIAVKPFFYDASLAERADFTLGKNTAKNQGAVAELLMKDLGSYDIHDRLSVIKCPTLVIHGDSELLPCEVAYKVHRHIPGSKFVVLKNTGHFMFIESPEAFFSIIRKFLKDDKSVENSMPPEVEERLKSISF